MALDSLVHGAFGVLVVGGFLGVWALPGVSQARMKAVNQVRKIVRSSHANSEAPISDRRANIHSSSRAGGNMPANRAKSLKMCYLSFQKVGLGSTGARTCQQSAQKFDYSHLNFQACFDIYRRGYHKADAPVTCRILSKKFQFTSNVFHRCYVDQKKKIGLEEAATACMNYVNNLKYLQGFSG